MLGAPATGSAPTGGASTTCSRSPARRPPAGIRPGGYWQRYQHLVGLSTPPAVTSARVSRCPASGSSSRSDRPARRRRWPGPSHRRIDADRRGRQIRPGQDLAVGHVVGQHHHLARDARRPTPARSPPGRPPRPSPGPPPAAPGVVGHAGRPRRPAAARPSPTARPAPCVRSSSSSSPSPRPAHRRPLSSCSAGRDQHLHLTHPHAARSRSRVTVNAPDVPPPVHVTSHVVVAVTVYARSGWSADERS